MPLQKAYNNYQFKLKECTGYGPGCVKPRIVLSRSVNDGVTVNKVDDLIIYGGNVINYDLHHSLRDSYNISPEIRNKSKIQIRL
jgi:hypothetical protein